MSKRREEVLLIAAAELLEKIQESAYEDALSETASYDGTECDGYCLLDDLRAFVSQKRSRREIALQAMEFPVDEIRKGDIYVTPVGIYIVDTQESVLPKGSVFTGHNIGNFEV